jgi:heptosyltransferase-2
MSTPEKIAVFMPNWVGDAIMATPAMTALRQQWREAEIHALHRPVIGSVLEGQGLVDRQIVLTKESQKAFSRASREMLKSLRSEAYDLAILFPNSFRSAWLAARMGARKRLGFARDGRTWLLTDHIPPKSKKIPNPVMDEYSRLVETLGIAVKSNRMTLSITDGDQAAFEGFRSRNRSILHASEGYIALNPGGAFGAAKHWPTEHFATLAQRLVSETGLGVVVLCGPAEIAIAKQIVELANSPRVTSLANESVSIGLSKAVVKHARMMVTTDSGPRHFAAAFGVPVVTLFGPTHIAWSETYYPLGVHLQHQVDCGPCQQRTCPQKHHKCMRDLSVERVFSNVQTLLARTSTENPTIRTKVA